MSAPSITHGPIGRALLALAWPVIAGEALHTAFHVVDIAWIGPSGARIVNATLGLEGTDAVAPLGPWATGAIMTSMFTLWIAFALTNLVGVGLAAHVSRRVGAGRRDEAGRFVSQALWLALLLSLPVAAAGWLGAHGLFRVLVSDPRSAAAGGDYLALLSLVLPLQFLYATAAAAMRACGNTRVPLAIGGGAVLLNIVLAPFLVYGLGPLPALGVQGSAIATIACQAAAFVAFLVIALVGHRDLPIDRAALRRPEAATLLAIARIGAPYCAVGLLFSGVYLWYANVTSAFGAAALAVLGIGNRLESVTYLSADGFAVAASTFVGQNLGAGNPDRAARGAWHAAWLMSAASLAFGALMAAFPAPLIAAFTDDPEALRLGVPWLQVLGLCQVFTGFEGVIGGAFAGAGDTLPPMLAHGIVALVRLPLASWAAFDLGMGPLGVVWTMSLTCVVRAIALGLWFRRGRWKLVALPEAAAGALPPGA